MTLPTPRFSGIQAATRPRKDTLVSIDLSRDDPVPHQVLVLIVGYLVDLEFLANQFSEHTAPV